MYLKRQDIITNIIWAFNDYDYKSAITRRIGFGFNISPLTYSECASLNNVVKELDNNMLDEVYFYPSMPIDNFDLCISRLLYVSGRWLDLCFYNFIIMNDIKNEIVTIDCSTESITTMFVYFSYGSKSVKMCVDDEKIAIKIETITMQEKEF